MSQRALLTAAAGGAIGLVLLTFLLVELHATRGEIEAQRDLTAALYERSAPVLEDAGPVLGGTQALIRDLSAGRPDLLRSLDELPGILNAASAVATRGAHVLGTLSNVDLAALLVGVERLTDVFLADGRVEELIVRANSLLTRVENDDLIGATGQGLQAIQAVLAVQRRILRVQRGSRQILLRSLAVQEDSLKHIRSIDRKTGGPIPPAG